MADVKISELDEAATIGSNDSLVGIQGVKTKRFKIGKLLSSENISFDNTDSGLSANTVKGAIDELAAGGVGGGADEETIAPVEESTTASTAHPLGSIFYLNGVLYRALADIAIGGTINTAAGGNATQTTVAQNFKRTVTLTSAEYALLSAAEKAADIVYIVTDDSVDYGDYVVLIANLQNAAGGTYTVQSLSQFRYIMVTVDYINSGNNTNNSIVSNMIPIALFSAGKGAQAEYFDGTDRHYFTAKYYSNTQITISSPTNLTSNFVGFVYGIK